MRNQTPIQQQRTTQTQQRRSRPHNPSITRRIQSPGQRQSVMRQMQQQTRQRPRRQRQGTPLPEKRRRKRQTTRSRHANATHRHMVNTHRHSNNRKGGVSRKARSGREKRRQDDKENAMVFGDNVRARRAARALPRTPNILRKKSREDKTRHAPHRPTALPTRTRTITTIPQ